MNVNVELLFWLLIFYQFKHFFADFVFQNVWMLQKSRPGWDFVLPLTIHSGIHSILTLVISVYISPHLWWLAVIDFVVHFIMDRLKSGPKYFGRYSDVRSKSYWICFGFDQMMHHLTHIYICWVLATFH